MDDQNMPAMRKAFPSVSPYLLRPLRSYEQAQADIAAAKKSSATVTALIPLAATGRKHRDRKPDLAA